LGAFLSSCARAVSGHATAALPSTMISVRRFIDHLVGAQVDRRRDSRSYQRLLCSRPNDRTETTAVRDFDLAYVGCGSNPVFGRYPAHFRFAAVSGIPMAGGIRLSRANFGLRNVLRKDWTAVERPAADVIGPSSPQRKWATILRIPCVQRSAATPEHEHRAGDPASGGPIRHIMRVVECCCRTVFLANRV